MQKVYSFMWWNICLVSFESWELICSLYQVDWRNFVKQSVTVGAQLLWGGRYGCNNGRYGCTIVMSYIEINKAVSQWLLTFNLCVSVTWPLTCAFHIPCTHTPEIIDMHRGVCVIYTIWYMTTHVWGKSKLKLNYSHNVFRNDIVNWELFFAGTCINNYIPYNTWLLEQHFLKSTAVF